MGAQEGLSGPIFSAEWAGEWEQCGQLCRETGSRPGVAPGNRPCKPRFRLGSGEIRGPGLEEMGAREVGRRFSWRSRGLVSPREESGKCRLPGHFRRQVTVPRPSIGGFHDARHSLVLLQILPDIGYLEGKGRCRRLKKNLEIQKSNEAGIL